MAPWLAAVARWLAARAARGTGPEVRIVHLAGPPKRVAQRLATRRGHFMPPELLDSQYAALEPLGVDEPGITVDLAAILDQIADELLRAFGLRPHSVG